MTQFEIFGVQYSGYADAVSKTVSLKISEPWRRLPLNDFAANMQGVRCKHDNKASLVGTISLLHNPPLPFLL
jgi:hypothetical protein